MEKLEAGRADPAAAAFQDVFRDVMAAVCAPVAVVTAIDGTRPHGTTVSAFASLSLAPPMLLVALDRGSDLLTLVERTRRFGTNVLASGQDELALRFARKGADKFDGVPWSPTSALPRIAGALGWVACDVVDVVPGGDHQVVIGRATDVDRRAGAPLTYWQRSFGTHLPRAAAAS